MKTPSSVLLVSLRVAAAAAFLALVVVAFVVPGRHGPNLQTAAPVSAPKTAAIEEAAGPVAPPSVFAPAGLMSATDRTANPSASGSPAMGGLPWNGLNTNFAGGADFANRGISATPAPSAVVSIEPVAGGDRTDGPLGDPRP
jgi:hypothetical protein